MKISIGELRHLINEVMMSPKEQTRQLVQRVIDASEAFVLSVVNGTPNTKSASDLRDVSDQIISLSRWLINKQEANSKSVAIIANCASELAELTKFWNRPSFLGTDRYLKKIQSLLSIMQRKQVDTLL